MTKHHRPKLPGRDTTRLLNVRRQRARETETRRDPNALCDGCGQRRASWGCGTCPS